MRYSLCRKETFFLTQKSYFIFLLAFLLTNKSIIREFYLTLQL
nr:MAG TPA_asm: hypothetical protein [Caudoviricetes sp.]